MDKVACQFTQAERAELFEATATKMKVTPIVVEKDFWVCWILKRIFASESLKDHMVFKGGTSLSKAYHLIERFSEDIDLILDWTLLGYDANQPNIEKTKTQQDKFNKRMVVESSEYIRDHLISDIQALLEGADCIAEMAEDDADQCTINVSYPVSFPDAYIRPVVRLEIGPLAKWIPSDWRKIKPYAYEYFPGVFEEGEVEIFTIDAKRTFWEKATILHQEAYDDRIKARYSRHYYDLYKLGKSRHGESALQDLELLRDVVSFKKKFYPTGKANYDKAEPGSFQLIPSDAKLKALEKDYKTMESMIFGDTLDFNEIVTYLATLENLINSKDNRR